ncbi:porin [Psychromonas algicola]|uniref:porin n=1 Tax=Psychromonas algicola TaxID=2555642 RepID=UPI0010677F45|nr:porin [Psychromonas sp. RZ5]TEW48529.1 porin [Psychromonas sp. RZ5]
MKKALLAVLIPSLLGATSAFAGGVDLIKNDDMTLNFNGDIDLKSYITFTDTDGDYKSNSGETEVIFDDIDFKFTWHASDNLDYIAGMDLTADPDGYTEIGAAVGVFYAWAGFNHSQYGQLTWGNQITSFDNFGIDTAEIWGGAASGKLDGRSTEHSNALVYEIEIDDLTISATYGINNEDDSDDFKNAKVMQVTAFYKPGDLQINAGVGHTTGYNQDSADFAQVSTAVYGQAEVEYQMGDISVAGLVAYQDAAYEDNSANTGSDFTSTGVEFDVTYKLSSTVKLSVGGDYITQDIDNVSDNDAYMDLFVASKHTLTKNVYLLTELAMQQGDLIEYRADKDSVSTTSLDDAQVKVGFLLNMQF